MVREDNKRKHHSQMNGMEVVALLNAVRSRRYKLGDHISQRMVEKKVRVIDIARMLPVANVVEAHANVPNDIRVLVRGKVDSDDLCVVFSLNFNEVVTAYWNNADDSHETLDTTKYQWQVNLVEIIA